MALLILAGLASLIAVGVSRSMTELTAAQISAANQQVFHIADAGVDVATVYLRSLPSPPELTQPFDPFGGPQKLGGGEYQVTLNPSLSNDNSFTDDYNITVKATVNGVVIQRKLVAMTEVESFSRFAHFANEMKDQSGHDIWWTSGTSFSGPVHVNGKLNIDGSPTFDGRVSSTASEINYANGGPPNDTPSFNQGLDLKVNTIKLPNSLDTLKDNSRVFEGDASVEINGSTLFITNKGQTKTYDVSKPVFVTKGDLTLKGGTLQGRLTLGTERSVIIQGGVELSCNPEAGWDPDCPDPNKPSASKDLLGIVAKKDVIVSTNDAGDLTLQATIMAVNGAFKVDNYDVCQPKGTLKVFGGVIQHREGHVGTVDVQTGKLLSGYREQYVYDPRLLKTIPPYYPLTGRYVMQGWWVDYDTDYGQCDPTTDPAGCLSKFAPNGGGGLAL